MELSLPKPVAVAGTETAVFIAHVYQWMALGLVTTAVTAYLVSTDTALLSLFFSSGWVFLALILAELALVFTISGLVTKLSLPVAVALFTTYSILNGLTFSFIFLAYTGETIFTAFAATAGTFAVMSVYGLTTKRDLTTIGHLAFMALIGVLIAMIVNLFLGNSMLNLVISVLGVLIFVGLIAYDNQRLKAMSSAGSGSSFVIAGALALYLDFINLFLFILNFLGGRRR